MHRKFVDIYYVESQKHAESREQKSNPFIIIKTFNSLYTLVRSPTKVQSSKQNDFHKIFGLYLAFQYAIHFSLHIHSRYDPPCECKKGVDETDCELIWKRHIYITQLRLHQIDRNFIPSEFCMLHQETSLASCIIGL